MSVNNVKRALLRLSDAEMIFKMWEFHNFITHKGEQNDNEVRKQYLKYKTLGVVYHDRMLHRGVK